MMKQNAFQDFGLGRIESEDDRNKKFPMSAVLLPATIAMDIRYKRYWNSDQWHGHQYRTPHCVAFAGVHWLEDGPVTHKKPATPILDTTKLYKAAQDHDEWPGNAYDGTSALGLMKVLQALGLIKSYRWGYNVEDVVAAVLQYGPVLVGTIWERNMFFPETVKIHSKNKPIIRIGGPMDGGHEYLINGVNTKTELFRIKNSWGREWGVDGEAYISFDDFRYLMERGGDVCMPIENEKPDYSLALKFNETGAY